MRRDALRVFLRRLVPVTPATACIEPPASCVGDLGLPGREHAGALLDGVAPLRA